MPTTAVRSPRNTEASPARITQGELDNAYNVVGVTRVPRAPGSLDIVLRRGSRRLRLRMSRARAETLGLMLVLATATR
jgi:hypothetical protein